MMRLFCFPSAGNSAAMYRAWPAALAPSVEVVAVELPGRGGSFREPLRTDLRALVDAIGPALRGRMNAPFAFFGHSMGALVAYGLTRWLVDRGAMLPRRLLLSSFSAPHLERPAASTHDLPEDQLLAHVIGLGGVPDTVLREREILQHLLPVLRADLAVCETCTPEPPLALPVPICAYGGAHDPMVPRASLEAWAAHTRAGLDVELFPGGHFYLQDPRSGLLRSVAARLAASIHEKEGHA